MSGKLIKSIFIFFIFVFLLSAFSFLVPETKPLYQKISSFYQHKDTVVSRYFFLLKCLAKNQWGYSSNGKQISELVVTAFKNSLFLLCSIFIISLFLIFILFFILYLEYPKRSWWSKLIEKALFLFFHLPSFVIAIIFIYFFSLFLKRFFSYSFPILGNFYLLLGVGSIIATSQLYFLLKESWEFYLQKEDIRYLKMLNFSDYKIFFSYLFPYLRQEIFQAFLSIWRMLWGIIIILEIIFSWPGLGWKMFNALKSENLATIYLSLILIFSSGLLLDFFLSLFFFSTSLDKVDRRIGN